MNRSRYTWSDTSQRYRDSRTGRFVSAAAVRDELDKSIDASAKAIREATEGLRAGTLALSAWQLVMADEIRNGHLASTALARGGWSRLTVEDYRAASKAVAEQYKFLRNFAADVASGKQKLDGTLIRRAELYTMAARGQYEDTRREAEAERGLTEERRIRHARDSCETCIEEERKGWQPIGTLRRIGDSLCRSRCRCQFEYRLGEAQ